MCFIKYHRFPANFSRSFFQKICLVLASNGRQSSSFCTLVCETTKSINKATDDPHISRQLTPSSWQLKRTIWLWVILLVWIKSYILQNNLCHHCIVWGPARREFLICWLRYGSWLYVVTLRTLLTKHSNDGSKFWWELLMELWKAVFHIHFIHKSCSLWFCICEN